MKSEVYERLFARRQREAFMESPPPRQVEVSGFSDMGSAPGGRMKQKIYRDLFGIDDWDQDQSRRCFVHIANSLA